MHGPYSDGCTYVSTCVQAIVKLNYSPINVQRSHASGHHRLAA